MPQTFEGFNFGRPQDQKKSAKDSFAFHAGKAPDAPTGDKNQLGAWFDQYIKPGFEADGHKTIGATQGDKFTYGNHERNFSVDFGRGAGAPGGALAWQADPYDQATQQRYPQSSGSGTAPAMSGQSDLMSAILASLQQSQQQEVDPQALLLQALR
jgi:hypothetical protein